MDSAASAAGWLRYKAKELIVEGYTKSKAFVTSFMGMHYAFMIATSLILSWIIYPMKNMSYTDALYLAVSTCTNTGMGPLTGNVLPLYQQIFMLIFSALTHTLVINWGIVLFRIWLYEKHFDNINERSRMQSKARRINTRTRTRTRARRGSAEVRNHAEDVVRSLNMMQIRAREHLRVPYSRTFEDDDDDCNEGEGPALVVKHPMEIEQESGSTSGYKERESLDEGEGPPLVVRHPADIEKDSEEQEHEQEQAIKFDDLPRPRRADSNTGTVRRLRRQSTTTKPQRTMTGNYLSYTPTITGSVFVGLTKEQKDELGGVEYRALKLLSTVLISYFLFWLFLSWVVLAPWCAARTHYKEIFESEGYNPAWNGIFLGTSAFLNYGYSLSPQSMTMFQTSAYVPLWTIPIMLAGDIAQPVFLRFILWCMYHLVPVGGAMRESLGFLLDHPRRCFLLLFPSKSTWILVGVILGLNLVDVVVFLAIEFHGIVVAGLPGGYKFMVGIYQAICLRTAGFNIIDIAEVRPSVQLSYIFMMYVSVLPIAISVRKTNVYEEQTLGVFYPELEDDNTSVKTGRTNNMHTAKPFTTHIQRQLSHDLWILFLGLFVVCICEDKQISDGNMTFLDVFFELMSAYSTVGISAGYPGVSYALSGKFNTVAKLVVIFLMLRGRHRGLPYNVDRAIMIKRDKVETHDGIQEQWGRDLHSLAFDEEEDPQNWLSTVNSNVGRLRRSTTMLRPTFSRMSGASRVTSRDREPPRRRARSFNLA